MVSLTRLLEVDILAKEIPLTNGGFTIVDDEDYEWLKQYVWHRTAHNYVSHSYYDKKEKKTKSVRMQRFILDVPDNMVVDHINRNTFDNRRENLRICTTRENNFNKGSIEGSSSEFKGVIKRTDGSYEVSIRINGVKKYLGRFTNEVAAANCYNHFAKQEYGEFAYLNDVPVYDDWFDYHVKHKKTSSYLGVSFNKQRNAWTCKISKGEHKIQLLFSSEEAAANCYNHYALIFFEDDAKLNNVGHMTEDEWKKYRIFKDSVSKYIGVSKTVNGKKWRVRININKKEITVGTFDTELEAAVAYNEKAIELGLPKSKLNIID